MSKHTAEDLQGQIHAAYERVAASGYSKSRLVTTGEDLDAAAEMLDKAAEMARKLASDGGRWQPWSVDADDVGKSDVTAEEAGVAAAGEGEADPERAGKLQDEQFEDAEKAEKRAEKKRSDDPSVAQDQQFKESARKGPK